MTWWPNASFGMPGPYPGQNGRQVFRSSKTIPVGEWFHVEARYVCDSNYNGTLQFWLNGEEVFNLRGVQTADPDTNDCLMSINNYGSDLEESRIDIYVDDFIASPTRVGTN